MAWHAISRAIISGKWQRVFLQLNRDHKASEQAKMSGSRRKIQLQETVESEEIDEEKWTKLKGRSIVSGERLQKTSRDAISCRFC